MRTHYRLLSVLAVGALALGGTVVGLVRHSSAQAESTSQPPSASDQGTLSPKIELLFVQNSTAGTYDGRRLTLEGVGPTVFFSDRPYRIAGKVRTSEFITHWDKGSDNFAENPPNATLSIFTESGVDSAVVELTDPKLQAHTLSYAARVLQGTLPASFQESSLFIDIFGRWRMFAYGAAMGRATAPHYAYVPPPAPAPAPAPAAPVYVAPAPPPPPRQVNVTVTQAPGQPASQADTEAAAVARLKELKALLNQGLITQSQYEEESQKLLNQIVQ
jgi:hypothetical protein